MFSACSSSCSPCMPTIAMRVAGAVISMDGSLFYSDLINVESVAWVAERKNVLSMFFFLLAMHAYDRYARSGSRYFYGWVTVLFALGLMAEPQIVTLPFVLLLWDYWPLERMRAPTPART